MIYVDGRKCFLSQFDVTFMCILCYTEVFRDTGTRKIISGFFLDERPRRRHKNIFNDKMDLRLFYFHVTIYPWGKSLIRRCV